MQRSFPDPLTDRPADGAQAAAASTVDPERAPRRTGRWGWREGLVGLSLLLAVALAYHNVWHAGFIWDDNGHVTRQDLRSFSGLARIWFSFGATQQYYPVLHTAFWIEHRLWGDSPTGYHLLNIVLHGCAAFLLYRILRRLRVPGAFFAAALFALHPTAVETVAWVSEQKNTLSTVFGFLAVLVYLRYDEDRRRSGYVAATAFFALALGSKSVTATLPAALLVILWWKRGSLRLRRDVVPLLPWFSMAVAAGIVTAWIERTYVGAGGAAFDFSIPQRFLVAGRAPWFYLGRLLWPFRLVFIYPRWVLDVHAAGQWVPALGVLGAFAAGFAVRRRTRGPLVAALLYAGLLFPALGFINVYPFVYSFVADHFQYLASAAMLSAVAAAGAVLVSRVPPGAGRALRVAGLVVIAGLAGLTWRRTAAFTDSETLWRTTLRQNPSCWMAWDNLGETLLDKGRAVDAIQAYKLALQVKPDDDIAYDNVGYILVHSGFPKQAQDAFEKALACNSENADAHNNLGLMFLRAGRIEDAVAHFDRALAIKPRFADAMFNLGDARMRQRRIDDALAEYRRGLREAPDSIHGLLGLARALVEAHRTADATGPLERIIELDPGNAEANNELGGILAQEGRLDAGISHFRQAIASRADFAPAHWNLGNALLRKGSTDDAIAELRAAVRLAPPGARIHDDLGLALMSVHRVSDAEAEFRKALEIDPAYMPARRNMENAESLLQSAGADMPRR